MCGIAGYWSRDRAVGMHRELKLLSDPIRHRGPDDFGFWHNSTVGLANRRLSIIDVEGGHQPFISDDGNIIVVQNGEIYNYIELARQLESMGSRFETHSDTEVLLRLYETYGIDMLSRLNGMFAIAIFDQRQKRLYLARDRAGVKPLYVHDDGKALRFASEVKSLLAAGIDREVDYAALHQFMTFNYVPPPATLFRGVRHVMPGHYMTIDDAGVSTTQWWSLEVAPYSEQYNSAWESQFGDLLKSAVSLRMRADVPFGAFLSGGVDSSAVVAAMAREASEPVRSFCIGFDDSRFDESGYAETLAERVGARHRTQIVQTDMLRHWPLVTYYNDQPHGDVSFMPTYEVSAMAAEEVKLVLTGDGGDELFAGYGKYRDFFANNPRSAYERSSFESNYINQLLLFDSAQLEKLYSGGLRKNLDWTALDQLAPVLAEQSTDDGINLALYIDFKWLLPGNNLVKPDRMGMANSLEARSPFMDYRFVEWAFSLPGSSKLKDGTTKYLMKAAVTPLVGADIAYRKKQMFTVPIGEWLKDRAHALVSSVLFSETTTNRGLFDATEVRRMFDWHNSGRANYTRELRALVALELWMRTFIDNSFASPPDWSDLEVSFESAA